MTITSRADTGYVVAAPRVERAPITLAPAVRRSWAMADLVGVVVTAAVMLGISELIVVVRDTPLGRDAPFGAIALALGALALIGVVWLRLRREWSIGEVLRQVAHVWTDPPSAFAAFVLGVILALPILTIFYPTLYSDSDAARLLASIRYVQHGHLGYFRDTQEPLLPHVVVGPVSLIGGLGGVKLASIFMAQVFVGVVAYICYRVTSSMVGAGTSALALLSLTAVYERADTVPMYPAMLALGSLGAWFSLRAIAEPEHRWRNAIVAGLCLALTPEAQAVGQLFLVVPVMLLIVAPSLRKGLVSLARIYVVVILASIPRLLINLSEGGLSQVTGSRTDYWITQGYINDIQQNFWRLSGITEPRLEYLSHLPGRVFDSFGPVLAAVAVFVAVVALVWCLRGRARWFAFAMVGFYVLAVTVKRIPPYSRYYSPLWPGLAILVGVGVGALVAHRTVASRIAAAVTVVALGVTSVAAISDYSHGANGRRTTTESQPYEQLAAAIDDGKGVIGARAHQILYSVTDDIDTWGDQFLTEAEYVTYLTWPSDQQVIDVLRRHNIGWALVSNSDLFETTYNDAWLTPHYGRGARHVQALADSPNFCRRLVVEGYALYQVGSSAGAK